MEREDSRKETNTEKEEGLKKSRAKGRREEKGEKKS